MVLPVASTQLARAPAAPDGGLLARTSLLYVRAMCTGQQPGMRMRGALVAALQAQGARCPRGGTGMDEAEVICILPMYVSRMWDMGWCSCYACSMHGAYLAGYQGSHTPPVWPSKAVM